MEQIDIGITRPELPLLWSGKKYIVLDWGIANRKPFAKIKPHNSKLVAELKRRLKKDSNVTLRRKNGHVYLDGDKEL